jgi:hypothetical protein
MGLGALEAEVNPAQAHAFHLELFLGYEFALLDSHIATGKPLRDFASYGSLTRVDLAIHLYVERRDS